MVCLGSLDILVAGMITLFTRRKFSQLFFNTNKLAYAVDRVPEDLQLVQIVVNFKVELTTTCSTDSRIVDEDVVRVWDHSLRT
jgi:hypothetical protein